MKRPSPRQLGQEMRLAGGRMRDEFSRWTTYDRLVRQFEELNRTLERLEMKYQAFRAGIDRERAEQGLPPLKLKAEKQRVPDAVDLAFLPESPPPLPSSSPPSSESLPPEPSGG